MKFNRLTIIDENFGWQAHPNGTRDRLCLAICDCGSIVEVVFSRAKCGYTKSCGCLVKEKNVRPANERFFEKVNKTSECWLWTGYIYPSGYGNFSIKNKHIYAHRYSYELHFGEIPKVNGETLFVLHKCRSKNCVNPEHLYAGTQLENIRDAVRDGTHSCGSAAKTHCSEGHPLGGENTRPALREKGLRRCWICERNWRREYARKMRNSVNPKPTGPSKKAVEHEKRIISAMAAAASESA